MPLLPQKHREKPQADDIPPALLDSGDAQPFYHKVVCWMGFHEYELLEVQLSFVPGSSVEKVRCRYCHEVVIRENS